jgi:dynein heavy chain 2
MSNAAAAQTAVGSVATEALLATVAQRHLASAFPQLTFSRGDGSVTFRLGTALTREKDVSDTIEKLGQFALRELTGKTRLRHGDVGDIDFSDLRDKAHSFGELMAADSLEGRDTTQSGTFAAVPDFSDLPTHEGVSRMLELLYNDALNKNKGFTCVTKFPKHLSASELRMDVAVGGNVIVSLSAGAATNGEAPGDSNGAVLTLYSRDFAKLIAPFTSAPVESELPSQWRLRMFSLEEVNEVLSVVHQAIKQYWNSSNKTEKSRVNVTSLLAIVSGDLKDFIRDQLQIESADANGAWRMSLPVLKRAHSACVTWKALLDGLTAKGDLEQWTFGAYVDDSFDELTYRLETATRIRALLTQTSEFIGREHRRDVDPEAMFEGLTLADLSAHATAKWHAAVEKFEVEFSVLESSLIGKLRNQWQQFTADGGDRTLRAAGEMKELLQRERVAQALSEELRGVSTYLDGLLKEATGRYTQRKEKATTSFQRMVAARDVMAEAGPVLDSAKGVLSGKDLLDNVANNVQSIVSNAKNAMQTAVEQWKTDVAATVQALASRDEALVTVTRRPHPTDTEGLSSLALAANPRLDQLVSELAQVTVMAPAAVTQLPAAVQRSVTELKQMQAYSRRLAHQLANYNLLCKQVLSCTKGMLALALGRCETTVLPNGEVTRSFAVQQLSEMDMIVSKLHHAIETASNDNRAIRRLHNEVLHVVCGLYSVDLLRNAEQWRNQLKDLRTRFETFEKNQNVSGPGLDVWKRHWDYQLYKALEHQYQVGLEQLNESVDPFTVSLLFKQGSIHFKPGFESLREQYYAKIRDFVSIPNRFKGVSNAEFFAQMPARNAKAITTVHTKAMELFAKLGKLRRQFRDFVVVGACGVNGAFDLDTIVAKGATTVEEWEAGLKLCKERLKKAQSVQDKIVIDCIEVNTEQIKATMDDQVHKLEEALINSLRRATQQRLNEVDEFVRFASAIIEKQPTTLDDVGRANKAYLEFKEQLPAMEAKLAAQDQLQRLLKSVTGTTVDMSLVKSRWDHLMDAMASHQKQIDASVAKMRQSVDGLVNKFLKDVQRFSNHWNQHKPKDMATLKNKKDFEKALGYVKDQVLELGDLTTQSKELLEKCSYFKVHEPDFSLLRATEREVEQHSNMWSFYEGSRRPSTSCAQRTGSRSAPRRSGSRTC